MSVIYRIIKTIQYLMTSLIFFPILGGMRDWKKFSVDNQAYGSELDWKYPINHSISIPNANADK